MPGQKILVVDDSWTELTMIVTPLRNSGFDVVTAVDGDEAVEKVFKEHPQCIVLMSCYRSKMVFSFVESSKIWKRVAIFRLFC